MLEELEQAGRMLSGCAAAPTWGLPESELVACLDEVHRLEQVAAAVKLHLIGQIEGRHLEQVRQARGMAPWLGRRLRLDRWVARDLLAQAQAVGTHPVLDAALAAGEVDPRQVRVIADAVDVLPASIGKEKIAEAERALLDFAGRFEPARLRRLGDRILEWVAPEIAEEAERFLLERAEQRAWRRRGLTLSPPVDGAVHLRGVLTAEDAAVVRAALDPLCRSRPDGRTAAQMRADALVEVCRGARPGGRPAQVTVIVPFDPVRREVGAGTVDSGERVTPATVRRMACDADVLPVVLDTAGRPLDVGRSRRLFPEWLRRVLAARDRGCAFPECDRPVGWCDAHHVVSWLDGGVTSVDNGVLLCRGHHRLIHDDDSGWQIRPGADGLPDFLPPERLDPLRRPRRNLFHRRT